MSYIVYLLSSVFFIMSQLAVLAGDFLLSRACVALASLKNTEVRFMPATIYISRITLDISLLMLLVALYYRWLHSWLKL